MRPVTIIYYNDEFWLATGTNDEKVKQIKSNNNIELCYSLFGNNMQGYIRVFGQVIFINDFNTRKTLSDNFDYIKHFWSKPDAPDFTLIKIVPKEIEYLKIGEMRAERFGKFNG